jgi:predicted Zn-dependent protease
MLKPPLRIALLAAVTLLAACALLPAEAPPVSDNAAVRSLVAQAGADLEAGRSTNAAAGLERALRIEPRNPRLWQELARVRLAQGDAEQAEGLATRALSYAGTDRRLRAASWGLIAAARAARGDEAGAREAEARKREFE